MKLGHFILIGWTLVLVVLMNLDKPPPECECECVVKEQPTETPENQQ